jgi:radical SAM superfamily enzyme YgiQ (UPF0313 family)
LKKISFVNAQHREMVGEFGETNVYILPYSIGVLWEYAKLHGIENQYALDKIIFKRENQDLVIEQLKDSDVIGFSTYVWNRVYHYALARKIKERYPEKIIIFGGPEPGINDPEFINTHKFIDYFVKKEGEIILTELLKNLDTSARFKIPGLIINMKSGFLDTGDAQRLKSFENIPSPYLNGFFDKVMKENPDIEWNSLFETDRGCPYQCTFCDWGSLTYSKVVKFPIQRLFDELEWFAKNKISFMYPTTANFGIFGKRDISIAQKFVEIQKKYGYPKGTSFQYAKNHQNNVVEIMKVFSETADKENYQYFSVPLQSVSVEVLDEIKRKNMGISAAKEIFAHCEKNNIPVSTELILCLPKETLQSWKENYYKLYEFGQHHTIPVYQAQLLENAEMNLTQRKEHDIQYIVAYDYLYFRWEVDLEYKEGVKIAISTKDMPYEDMIKAQLWSWFMQTFHLDGPTKYISRFLRKYLNLSYSDFYEKLYQYIDTNKWWKKEKYLINSLYKYWTKNGEIKPIFIEGIRVYGWTLGYMTSLKVISENKYDEIFLILREFVEQEYNLPKDILDELFLFQQLSIPRYEDNKTHNFNLIKKFKYDVYGYIINDDNLYSEREYQFKFNYFSSLGDNEETLANFITNFVLFRKQMKISIIQ